MKSFGAILTFPSKDIPAVIQKNTQSIYYLYFRDRFTFSIKIVVGVIVIVESRIGYYIVPYTTLLKVPQPPLKTRFLRVVETFV